MTAYKSRLVKCLLSIIIDAMRSVEIKKTDKKNTEKY